MKTLIKCLSIITYLLLGIIFTLLVLDQYHCLDNLPMQKIANIICFLSVLVSNVNMVLKIKYQ